MLLVKAGRVVDDCYVRLLDDAAMPNDMAVIIPAVRLLTGAPNLDRRAAPTGVLWPNDRDVSELKPYLDRLALVALWFPTFRDGRAYSQARRLRERYGFHGELRATGQVLRDQFLFLVRAGFNAFEVVKEADAAAFADATSRYGIFYQPTGDRRPTALVARVERARTAVEKGKSSQTESGG
jgi:uncharacterized protein (DUF934 family)